MTLASTYGLSGNSWGVNMSSIAHAWEKGFRIVEPQINAEGTHLYPFDSSFPIDVRFFNFSGRNSVRMNRHHYCEIMYLASGRCNLRVQDRFFAVQEKDMIVVGSDLYHRLISLPKCPLLSIVLFFEPELIRATCGTSEEMEYLMPFLAQKADFPHIVRGCSPLAEESLHLILRIHEELPAATVQARLAVKTYLKMILLLLVKHYSAYLGTREDVHRKQADLERLRPLFEYLEKNYDSPIFIKDAARLCAMSKSHFMFFFKRATGQSFRSYVNQFRIAKAQDMLASTKEPISSISQAVAFCNQSYFGMMFRKLVGATPLAYRRQFANGHEIERAAVTPSPGVIRPIMASGVHTAIKPPSTM